MGKSDNLEIGDRQKQIEHEYKIKLPKKTHTVVRVDGRAFHTYTSSLKKPFDLDFMQAMDEVALELCQQMDGAVCAFVQSDEISIVMSDYRTTTTEAWMGGTLAKIVSLSAAIATAEFNHRFNVPDSISGRRRLALFDSRVFSIDDRDDLAEYLKWRQIDTRRNAISMIASYEFGHKPVLHKKTQERIAMLLERGISMNDYPDGFRHGRVVYAVREVGDVQYFDYRHNELRTAENVERRVWRTEAAPDLGLFGRAWLDTLLPEPLVVLA